MEKIIFVKPYNSTFILADLNMLEKHFYVTRYLMTIKKNPLSFIWALTKLFFFLLFNINKSDAVFTWFADYHAMVIVIVAKLFKKKVVLFAGGQEAICYPELQKGVYCKTIRGKCVRYALKNADLIIPNHKSLVYHENYYYESSGKKDGIQHYIPDLKTKIEIIPNGYDIEKFKRDVSILKKQNMILTIGRTITMADIFNKGYDLFIEVARRNPSLEFVGIAVGEHHLDWLERKYRISEILNLKIIPYLCPFETLVLYLNQAKVFVQASITEGMPNTLGEAMLFECIPVGSNVNGIPDSIGDTGVIVYKRDVKELESAILKALTLDTGKQAREHIIKNFSAERREAELMRVLSESNIF